MVWDGQWDDPLTGYLQSFAPLVGDRRAGVTLGETVRGIISAGSLVCNVCNAVWISIGWLTKSSATLWNSR